MLCLSGFELYSRWAPLTVLVHGHALCYECEEILS